MKKSNFLIGFILVISLLTNIIFLIRNYIPEKEVQPMIQNGALHEYYSNDVPMPLNGYLPNANMALKYGEMVLREVYGDKTCNNQKPFAVTLDENNNVWIITGTLPPNHLGGVATAIIKRDTGEIISLYHGM
jgi:hypothetical protein